MFASPRGDDSYVSPRICFSGDESLCHRLAVLRAECHHGNPAVMRRFCLKLGSRVTRTREL